MLSLMACSLPDKQSLMPSGMCGLKIGCLQRGFKPQVSIAENARLSGPLLSRFDIVLVLRDTPEAEWDAQAAEHILFADQQEVRSLL